MSVCKRCGAEGVVLFGHQGLCAEDYKKYQNHQKELREISIQNRELLAARIVHPAGKSPRYKAANAWRQRPYEFLGHDTSGGSDV